MVIKLEIKPSLWVKETLQFKMVTLWKKWENQSTSQQNSRNGFASIGMRKTVMTMQQISMILWTSVARPIIFR